MHHAPHPEHHDIPTPGSCHCGCSCPCTQEPLPGEHAHQGCVHRHRAFEAALHSIDPASVPSTEGVVNKFLYNLHGDADGFLLDGAQVHFAPHMSDTLIQAVQVGDRVSVQGLKRRGVDVLMALAITALKGKQTFDCAQVH